MTNVLTKLLDKLTIEELLELNAEINKKILDLVKQKTKVAKSAENEELSVGDDVYYTCGKHEGFWAVVEEIGETHAYIVDWSGERYMAPLKFLRKNLT